MKILYNGIIFTKNEFNPIIYIQSIKIDNKQNDNFISDDELSNYSSDDENFEEYFLDNLNKLGNDNLKKLKDNEFQNNNELDLRGPLQIRKRLYFQCPNTFTTSGLIVFI